jgi:hypothetical protein
MERGRLLRWKRKVWAPKLERAKIAYQSRSDLRRSIVSLLLHEGRTAPSLPFFAVRLVGSVVSVQSAMLGR